MKRIILVLFLLGAVGMLYAQSGSGSMSDFAKDVQEGETATANDSEIQENQSGVNENENVAAMEDGEFVGVDAELNDVDEGALNDIDEGDVNNFDEGDVGNFDDGAVNDIDDGSQGD